MSRLDDLPADQRAVLQLVLRQGRSYAAIADVLRLDDEAVRRRAHDALDALGPATTASPRQRARAGDWLLGQQDATDAAATLDALAADEPARAWIAELHDQLAPLASHPLPSLPAAPSPPSAGVAAPARPRVSRRGGAALLGLIALAAIVALVVVLTGGGADKAGSNARTTASASKGTQAKTTTRILAQVNLKAIKGSPQPKAIGVVQLGLVNGKQSLTAIAQGLNVTKGSSWGIWAEGGPGGTRWLGPFSQGDQQGRIYAQGQLEPGMDLLKYKRIVVSRDSAKTPPKAQGTPALAGAITPPKQQGG